MATLLEEKRVEPAEREREGILAATVRLDAIVRLALTAAEACYGPPGDDPFRGLRITGADLERRLASPAGAPLAVRGGKLPPLAAVLAASPRLAWLRDTFQLTGFEIDLLLIALGPELDPRYELAYAYLQDDLTRRRPRVNLALDLLCETPAAKLARRAHFAPEAALRRHRLLNLSLDPGQPESPLLGQVLQVDQQVVRFLVGAEGLDGRLAPFCERVVPRVSLADVGLPPATAERFAALLEPAWTGEAPLTLCFHGPSARARRLASEAVAAYLGEDLLVAHLPAVPLETLAPVLVREGRFGGSVLLLEGWDRLAGDDPGWERLLAAVAEEGGGVIFGGETPWRPVPSGPLGVFSLSLPLPDWGARRAGWEALLGDTALAPEDLDALAGRFRLSLEQIEDAVAAARQQARWRAAAPGGAAPGRAELFAAARGQTGHELAALARKIEPAATWADLVLPPQAVVPLRELCRRVALDQRVAGEWGFARRLSRGRGVNALFAGPSGTGKTMAAEVVANELELDLYQIDLARVVSKYIGETEKNLDRIFSAATGANAILFFDEADALFGKRSEVQDAHDRYANVEISYLLQKIEAYDGVAILATNLRQHLDEAFLRRLAFSIHFPFPGVPERRRLWAGIFPPETPLGADVDLDTLAARFALSGGSIRNVALAAAFLAADQGAPVTMRHLLDAVRREYEKVGKSLTAAELDGARAESPAGS